MDFNVILRYLAVIYAILTTFSYIFTLWPNAFSAVFVDATTIKSRQTY